MKSAFLPSKGPLCLYDKQNNTWLLIDMELLFSCSTRHLTRSLHSLASYRVKHSRGAFCCACPVNFGLIRETAGNVDGSGKSLKLLYYTILVYCVKGSYVQNAKDCSSLVSWLSGRSMKMMLFLKDASGLSKSTKELDSILLSCHCYLKLSVIIWSTRLSVSVF